ncbi:MBL fold metallo-hydrolase [Streptomyces virginiae]|uniref:MBL fold metallo-hydrolase n=1 Tax=Streptomyces virginiae TaxID=1961 RepID=UPI00369A79DE
MELDPAGLLPALPASYWRDHPEAPTGSGLIAASAGGVLVERGGRRLLIGVGLGSNILPASLGTSRGGALLSTLRALRVPPASVDTVAFTHLHTDHTGLGFVRDRDQVLRKASPRSGCRRHGGGGADGLSRTESAGRTGLAAAHLLGRLRCAALECSCRSGFARSVPGDVIPPWAYHRLPVILL